MDPETQLLVEQLAHNGLRGDQVPISGRALDAELAEIDVIIGHRARGPVPPLPRPPRPRVPMVTKRDAR